MITIRSYLKATSLEEAWKMNQKRANRVLGGMGWMKMSNGMASTAIDLSDLGLDQIKETDEEFIVGAMVSLRQYETHKALNEYFHNAPKESVKHIVGVQFRNCATVGGSAWLRAGFSDPITLWMSMDASVELYQGEEETVLIPMTEFCQMKKDHSIIIAVHIPKDGRKVAYESFRNTETDFPVLTVAVAKKEQNTYCASVGARPYLSKMVQADDMEGLQQAAVELSYDNNLRGSAEYRKMLAQTLIKRAFSQIEHMER